MPGASDALTEMASQYLQLHTRREELLLQPEILQKTRILRQFLYNMDEIESMEMVLKQMRATKTNGEFFEMMRRGG